MAQYAMVNDEKGFVANMVEIFTPGEFVAPAGHTLVLADGVFVGPGFTYDGTDFFPPPQLEPGTPAP